MIDASAPALALAITVAGALGFGGFLALMLARHHKVTVLVRVFGASISIQAEPADPPASVLGGERPTPGI